MSMFWDNCFADRTQQMKASAIREMLKITEQPDIISFGGGLPSPDSFPLERFSEACQRVIVEQGRAALQYGATEGYTPLRELIAAKASTNGLNIAPENVLITSGSQQALDLIGKIMINRGDRIVVEAPTYLGALQAWDAYGAEYVTVPLDDDGMDTNVLEEVLKTRPKFIYALPNFQNPSGVTMSLERRRRLVELADRYRVPLIEDDPYRQLYYEGEELDSVLKLNSDYSGIATTALQGNVIYLSTFSKILSPGIRLAWVIAPVEVINKMVIAKQGVDLHTSSLAQRVAYEMEKDNYLEQHAKFIRDLYRERRDAMLAALERHFPANTSWTHPKGGLFLWSTVPSFIDTVDLVGEAVKRKVAFVPGTPFYPDGRGRNQMRLNFSFSSPEMINEGIARLGSLLGEASPREADLEERVAVRQ